MWWNEAGGQYYLHCLKNTALLIIGILKGGKHQAHKQDFTDALCWQLTSKRAHPTALHHALFHKIFTLKLCTLLRGVRMMPLYTIILRFLLFWKDTKAGLHSCLCLQWMSGFYTLFFQFQAKAQQILVPHPPLISGTGFSTFHFFCHISSELTE